MDLLGGTIRAKPYQASSTEQMVARLQTKIIRDTYDRPQSMVLQPYASRFLRFQTKHFIELTPSRSNCSSRKRVHIQGKSEKLFLVLCTLSWPGSLLERVPFRHQLVSYPQSRKGPIRQRILPPLLDLRNTHRTDSMLD